MMSKRNLESEVLRTRGGHALPSVLARIAEMDEAEAREWTTLLRNLRQDAEMDGERRTARNPLRFR